MSNNLSGSRRPPGDGVELAKDMAATPLFRSKLSHRTPGWVDAPNYFITVCAQRRGVNQLCTQIAPDILNSVRFYHEKQRWFCDYAVLMPDHVHLLVAFHVDANYAKIVGNWKRWITTRHGVSWQENFFEHRVRDEMSLEMKGLYMANNPVRAGLVERGENWRWFWRPLV
jgi:REP element-mobilizing transposase RayT